MPRANRCFLPGHAWHITHRCHDRKFLLGAARDRDTWRHWLGVAASRHSLSVLDFVATSNHIHLLVYDVRGDGAVARGVQLVQARAAQSHNHRRDRRGAFWQDRYHAVAVDTDTHLWRCLAYIDLNMVRAGVVTHPRAWTHGGYNEIQSPRPGQGVIDLERLAWLTGLPSVAALQAAHREHVDEALANGPESRDPCWTEAIAVGSRAFTEGVRVRLGLSRRRRITRGAGMEHVLREPRKCYLVRNAREPAPCAARRVDRSDEKRRAPGGPAPARPR